MGSASSSEARSRRVFGCCDTKEVTDLGLLSNGSRWQSVASDEALSTFSIRGPIEDGGVYQSILQFSCAVYFITEDEFEMNVDIVRLGDQTGTCSVEYTTEDGSAKAHKKYESRSGTMTFKPGETLKTIQIPILNDDSWDATLDFGVTLTRAYGAHLGKHLDRCKVNIIEDDVFPTNKFAEKLRQGKAHDIGGSRLMLEYVKMNMRNKAIRRGTILWLLLDQVKNTYMFLTLYLQLYLVDIVLEKPETFEGEGSGGGDGEGSAGRRLLFQSLDAAARMLLSGDDEEGAHISEALKEDEQALWIPYHRRKTALLVGFLYIAPFAILHVIDLCKIGFGIAGTSKKILQANLLRKFLNYKEEQRDMINGSDITMSLVRDCTEVVEGGYLKLLMLSAVGGKLFFFTMFILAENHVAIIPLFACLLVMVSFLRCREGKTIRASAFMSSRQNEIVRTVNDAVETYRLLADFEIRPYMVDTYEECIMEFNASQGTFARVMTNNMYLAPWLTTFLIGGYMVYGSYHVKSLGGTLTLGTFLTTINIFKELGNELLSIYVQLMFVQKSFGPLQKICNYMNQETDLVNRKEVNRMRRSTGKRLADLAEERKCASVNGQGAKDTDVEGLDSFRFSKDVIFVVDTVNISIQNLNYAYGSGAQLWKTNVHATFPQGKMYAFVGPAREGKATLLKLLGQVLMPQTSSGTIFVPPHLRVLHVALATTCLDAPFSANIIFDLPTTVTGGLPRIRRICERLLFTEDMVTRLLDDPSTLFDHAEDSGLTSQDSEDGFSADKWQARLSHTDRAKLSLARAFVMNPEILVLHKPALAFNELNSKEFINMIRSHVDERGVELPVDQRFARRPRTVFFTSSTTAGLKSADEVYEVSAALGLRKIISKVQPKSQVSHQWCPCGVGPNDLASCSPLPGGTGGGLADGRSAVVMA